MATMKTTKREFSEQKKKALFENMAELAKKAELSFEDMDLLISSASGYAALNAAINKDNEKGAYYEELAVKGYAFWMMLTRNAPKSAAFEIAEVCKLGPMKYYESLHD